MSNEKEATEAEEAFETLKGNAGMISVHESALLLAKEANREVLEKMFAKVMMTLALAGQTMNAANAAPSLEVAKECLQPAVENMPKVMLSLIIGTADGDQDLIARAMSAGVSSFAASKEGAAVNAAVESAKKSEGSSTEFKRTRPTFALAGK